MDSSRKTWYLPANPREWFALVAACVAGVYLFGDDLWRVVTQSRTKIRDSVRDSASIETEVERARMAVASLIPDIRGNHELIIHEQFDIEELRREIQNDRRNLSLDRETLLDLRSDLELKDDPPRRAATVERRALLRKELQQRFAAYQAAEAALAAKTQLLEIREAALDRAKLTQNEILQKKRELDAQIAQLEARLRVVQATGVDNQIRVDRTRLAQTEEHVRYLRRRMTVAEQITDPEVARGEVPTATYDTGADEIETEVDQYFVDRITKQ